MNPGLHGHEYVLQIVKNNGWNIYKKYRKVLWLMRLVDIGYFWESRKLDSQLENCSLSSFRSVDL